MSATPPLPLVAQLDDQQAHEVCQLLGDHLDKVTQGEVTNESARIVDHGHAAQQTLLPVFAQGQQIL